MAEQNINTIIKNKIDTAENWELNSPVLAEGEMGIDSTNNIFKLGDGVSTWNEIEKFYKFWENNSSGGGYIFLPGGYAELVALAAAGQLIPGKLYLTDS